MLGVVECMQILEQNFAIRVSYENLSGLNFTGFKFKPSAHHRK